MLLFSDREFSLNIENESKDITCFLGEACFMHFRKTVRGVCVRVCVEYAFLIDRKR